MARRQKLTKAQAIAKLTETRSLSTDLLEPLGLPFESFLQFAQRDKETQEKVMSDLIAFYNGDADTKRRMVREAQEKIAQKNG